LRLNESEPPEPFARSTAAATVRFIGPLLDVKPFPLFLAEVGQLVSTEQQLVLNLSPPSPPSVVFSLFKRFCPAEDERRSS